MAKPPPPPRTTPAPGTERARLLTEATTLHQAGRMAEAEALYLQLLERNPSDPDALHLLGQIMHGRRSYPAALGLIDRAIAAAPKVADYRNSRGVVLLAMEKPEAAIEAFDQALAREPQSVKALSNKANALRALGRREEALALYRQALRLAPSYAEGHYNLGNALREANDAEGAMAAYRQVIELKPDFAPALHNLATLLRLRGSWEEALALYERTMALVPDHRDALLGRAICLHELKRYIEAERAFRWCLDVAEDSPAAWIGLGLIAVVRHDYDQAIEHYRRALAFDPDSEEGYWRLAFALAARGDAAQARAHYQHALTLRPKSLRVWSSYLMNLHYDDGLDAQALFEAHRDFGQAMKDHWPRLTLVERQRDPARRLKIGLVSPDFYRHSCSYFSKPLIEKLDRAGFEVFCYSAGDKHDAMTDALREAADHWRDIAALDEHRAAQSVQSDGLDILIDLAGHTAGGRIGLFGRKPAPLQVTWLGYPDSVGLDAIDYRVTDERADPTGEADRRHVEKLLRLPSGFLCYQPPEDAPMPARTSDPAGLIFGCFNNANKVGPKTLDLWAELLKRLPQAELHVKWLHYDNDSNRLLLVRSLVDRGVAATQVKILPWAEGPVEAMAAYHGIDIALDPFPYNGTTTTCQALWMGVPVMSLIGDRHSARVGYSLLWSAGLVEEFAAASPTEFLDKTVALGLDRARLAHYRQGLRPRLAASALCDADRFAREMAAALRGIWVDYCRAAS